MHPQPIGYLTQTKDDKKPVCISPEARSRHTALFGKSGVGKTTLLRNQIVWDISNGEGVTVIDPHGQLIDEILEHIPKSRTNDVIYFKPGDLEAVSSINILERVPTAYQPLVVSSIVSTFKTIWANAWGQQSEYLLSNFCLALISQSEPTSLLDLLRLITDADYREKIFTATNDSVLHQFYRTYQYDWDDEQRAKASAPLLNKVSAFATNPLLRSVIGQHKSSFNFRDLLDSRKILLCDVSKGALGEDIASLLGSLITTKLYLASLSRQDTPERERIPHYFYIDEVHNFTHGIDLASILAEARKYRLSLTVATQTLAQLRHHNDSILPAIFGNCGTLISFRISGDDAVILAREFANEIAPSAFENLPDFELYFRSLTPLEASPALIQSNPLHITSFAPIATRNSQQKAHIIRTSQERYTKPRKSVDVWLNKKFASTSPPPTQKKRSRAR